jgi:Tfp pilus assembly protein PilN
MRPVNLIPVEERRGDGAALRTGPVAYLVIGALVAVLGAVTALVLTGNSISDRKDEIAKLRVEQQVAEQEAARLAPYADFRNVRLQRAATVTSLADSRFDWERVMRELALVLPADVWLINLTGTVRPDVQVSDSANVQTRSLVAGPALALVGCAADQDSVAGFISALEDIDGVTRVGLFNSKQPERSAAGGSGGASTSQEDCRTRDFITRFEIVAAFDAVATPPTASGVPAVPSGTDGAAVPTATSTTPSVTGAQG